MSHVALIEDEEDICGSLAALLAREGIRSRKYLSPFLFIVESGWKDARAVVADISMPEMDGIELGLTLRRKGFTGPILFITGLHDVPLSSFTRALEPYAVVRKPFRGRDLCAMLHIALGVRGPASAMPFEKVEKAELPDRGALPVDLFYQVEEAGMRVMQVTRAGESRAASRLLEQAFAENGAVYARAPDWRQYKLKA